MKEPLEFATTRMTCRTIWADSLLSFCDIEMYIIYIHVMCMLLGLNKIFNKKKKNSRWLKSGFIFY